MQAGWAPQGGYAYGQFPQQAAYGQSPRAGAQGGYAQQPRGGQGGYMDPSQMGGYMDPSQMAGFYNQGQYAQPGSDPSFGMGGAGGDTSGQGGPPSKKNQGNHG